MNSPSGWSEATLGELGTWQGGGTPSKAISAYWSNGTIPWVSPKDMKRSFIDSAEDYITLDAILGSTTNLIPSGALLLVMRSGILRHSLPAAITTAPVAINQDLKALTPSECVLVDFLLKFIAAHERQLLLDCTKAGTTVDSVDFERLKSFPIRLPPLAEQRRIVAKLDVLTSRLARARAELDQVPVLAARLRQAAIYAVTTSAAAQTVRFDDVLDYKGGSQPPKSTFHPEMAPGRIRLLQIRDFASDLKAVFIDDNGKWPRCEADDIMIGRYGASVGKILTGKAGAYNVALVKMVFNRSLIDPRFLFHWLKGDTFQGRLREISRSAQDGFNKEDLAELPFPLLPLIKQTQVAKVADNLIARADRLEAEATRARALLDRLESAILAKAFRGELVPQDPNDEPAQVLLDRIRAQRAAAPKVQRGRKTASLA